MYRVTWTVMGILAVAAPASAAGAQDFFTESAKDFGTTPRGPVLVHYFQVKNTSNQTVTLGQPRVSCGCVSASVVGKSQLAPGEATAVAAQMDTRRIPQANVVKSVTVYVPVFNGQYHEEAQLRVQAIARDDLVMSPDTVAFGTVRKGQGGKATTKITFYSDPNWKVTEPTSAGAFVKASVAEASRKGNEVAYEVTAELAADCPVGNWTTDLWVKTSAPGIEKLRIPVTVSVVSPIAVNPEAVTFGEVKVGGKAEQKVILQGTQPFKVMSVKGADGDVELVEMPEGAKPVHVLKLAFSPKAMGDITRTLEITTDHKEQQKVTVQVAAKVVK
jgi:hypothetical protein